MLFLIMSVMPGTLSFHGNIRSDRIYHLHAYPVVVLHGFLFLLSFGSLPCGVADIDSFRIGSCQFSHELFPSFERDFDLSPDGLQILLQNLEWPVQPR